MPITPEHLQECERLKRLFEEKSQLSQREFASRYKLGTPGNLWQYLNGRRSLNLDVAVKIAAGLGIEVADFSPRLAAKQREIAQPNIVPAQAGTKRIPILSFVQAGHLTETGSIPSYISAIDNGDFIYVDSETPDGYFALIIQGDSMSPDFREGDTIIIDPYLSPAPGDFVVAQRACSITGDAEATFKKYRPRGLNDNGQEYFELAPLNDDYPTFRSDVEKLTVVGVMVEHRRKYRIRRGI